MWIKETVNALAACVVTFVLCAVAYPAAVWGAGQLLFPEQAEGSLVYGRDRTVIGSELIAQPFASDRYFHPRPSAASPNGYAADAASGSHLRTRYQAAGVARARVMPVDQVLAAIDRHIERSGAILGAPARVNVLKLNRALDEVMLDDTH